MPERQPQDRNTPGRGAPCHWATGGADEAA